MSRVAENQLFTFTFFHLGNRVLVSPKEQPSRGHSCTGLEGAVPFVPNLHETFCPWGTKTSLWPSQRGAGSEVPFSPFSFDNRFVPSSSLWVPRLPLWQTACTGRQLPGLGRGAAAWRRQGKQKAHPWLWHKAPANWCVSSRIPSSRDGTIGVDRTLPACVREEKLRYAGHFHWVH